METLGGIFSKEDREALEEFLKEQGRKERLDQINQELSDWVLREFKAGLLEQPDEDHSVVLNNAFDKVTRKTTASYQGDTTIDPYELTVIRTFNLGVVRVRIDQDLGTCHSALMQIPPGTSSFAEVEQEIDFLQNAGSTVSSLFPTIDEKV